MRCPTRPEFQRRVQRDKSIVRPDPASDPASVPSDDNRTNTAAELSEAGL